MFVLDALATGEGDEGQGGVRARSGVRARVRARSRVRARVGRSG